MRFLILLILVTVTVALSGLVAWLGASVALMSCAAGSTKITRTIFKDTSVTCTLKPHGITGEKK